MFENYFSKNTYCKYTFASSGYYCWLCVYANTMTDLTLPGIIKNNQVLLAKKKRGFGVGLGMVLAVS